MFGSTTLDVAIGLAAIYSFLALIVTTVRESIESAIKSRSRTLERAIREMLGDAATASVYRHPLVSGLYQGGYVDPPPSSLTRRASWLWNLELKFLYWAWWKPTLRRAIWRGRPSYIPSRTFALAMLDTVGGARHRDLVGVASMVAARRAAVDACAAHAADPGAPPDAAKAPAALRAAIDAARLDPDRTIAELQAWYDGAMDRASGWYKRKTQVIVFALSLAVAVGYNVDAARIAKRLYHDQGLRDALVARAGSANVAGAATVTDSLGAIRTALDSLDLPIGFAKGDSTWTARGAVVAEGWAGILVSALAISLGAPFWFDLLNKLMVIRATVKPREKSRDEGSEDRRADGVSSAPPGGTGTKGTLVGAVPAGFPARQAPVGPGAEGELG